MTTEKLTNKIAWQDIPKGIAAAIQQGKDTYFQRDDIKKIVEMKDQGHSPTEISKKTGYTENAIEWAITYATKYTKKPKTP